MAQFAKLNENNIITEIHSVSSLELLDDTSTESEQKGIQFLTDWSNGHTNWKLISNDSNYLKRNAVIGYKYDGIRDAFIPPKPFPSWLLDETIFQWQAPVPVPDDENMYQWNEETQTYQRIEEI